MGRREADASTRLRYRFGVASIARRLQRYAAQLAILYLPSTIHHPPFTIHHSRFTLHSPPHGFLGVGEGGTRLKIGGLEGVSRVTGGGVTRLMGGRV